MKRQTLALIIFLGPVGCGVQSSPDRELVVMGSEFNVNLSTLFVCTTNIEDGEQAYADLELSSAIKITYSAFKGTNSTINERIVRAEIDTLYNLSGETFGTEDFDVSKTEYYQDADDNPAIRLAKDITGNDDGVWAFSIVDNQPSVAYTDTDLGAKSPVTINYDLTEGSSECSGSYSTGS
ncbi:hypothetical protein [Pseudobacteriovorax antillogorgiicola]|uniref:hypothetical protein n=1 Tax=Pseudobacteriovorax antillogorgiicola TaxID=1513793 RepID=UPI0010497364|nr:hypothetical protein [Pseudobacteriovorax antillogorgiicola]